MIDFLNMLARTLIKIDVTVKYFFYQKSPNLLDFSFFFWGYLCLLWVNIPIFKEVDLRGKYKEIYDSSIKNKESFWKEVSENVFWYKKPSKILNSDNPPFYKWFEDGITNTCYNALDYHIDQGRGEKIAIIYDSPITGDKKKDFL